MEACPLIIMQKIFDQYTWTVMSRRVFMERMYDIACSRGHYFAYRIFMNHAAHYWADHHIRQYP